MTFLYNSSIIRFFYGIVEVTRRPTLLSSTSGAFRYFSSLDKKNSDRYYTDKHEWVSIDGEIGTVGISHYAQEALGDIVFVQLPEVGTKLKKSDECGALESVKAASEIYSPVSGTVTEINAQIEELPGLINTNCLDRGWLFKLKLCDRKEIEQLMDQKRYAEFIKSDSNEK